MNHKAGNIRVGIIGAGQIVLKRHLPAFLRREDVEVVAVSNSTFESAERFCSSHLPSATPLKNWVDLLSLPDLDAVWIGAQPYMHAPVSVSALEAGKHVFCQARMAMDLAEAGEMLLAARRHPHLVTMLCPPPNGMRGNLLMKKLLAEHRIGRVLHVRLASLSSQFIDPTAPPHWRQRREFSGLNVLTLGIYAEVLQEWLGHIRNVSARGAVMHPFRQGYTVEVPDVLTVLCSFEGGAEGVLEFSGAAPFPPEDRLEIHGTEGKLIYNFSGDTVHLGMLGDEGCKQLPIPPEYVSSWTVEDDFFAAIRSGGSIRPRPSFEDGLRYMKVVQAVADSMAQGRAVAL